MLSMHLNNVLSKYIVCNKQIIRRMEGSSGGAISALLETMSKEDYYFSGAVYDEMLHVQHIVTNNPEDITRISGYKPIASDYQRVFADIQQLLLSNKKVVFCGTPYQCNELINFLPSRDNLFLIDIICSPFICVELYDKYLQELSNTYNSTVKEIQFYDKEFLYSKSKRVTLENGRTFFLYSEDSFDRLSETGRYSVKDVNRHDFQELEKRVGDITVGSYSLSKSNDGLGYSYISVNSSIGAELFEKSKKRLEVVCQGDEVDSKKIKYRKDNSVSTIDTSVFKHHTLDELSENLCRKNIINNPICFLKPIFRGCVFSNWNPFAIARFLKINFLTSNVHTDIRNNGLIYPRGHCAMKLVKGFEIELHGPLYIGTRRIKESRQETRLRMEKGAKLIVRNSCSFGAGSNVEIYRNAILDVGDLQSNAELNIICGQHIKLGSTCNIARNATIRDTSGHIIAIPGYKKSKPVEIGNHTWICSNATVMPGVKIGDGAIVGACSYVAKNVTPFTLVQGTPAQEVGNPKYFRI